MGPMRLTVLCPASHHSPVRPSQTASYSVRPFPALPPHSASSLVLSAWSSFPRSATQPIFSFVLWRATCNDLDFPGTPFLPSTRFHYALSRPVRPFHRPSCAGPLSLQIFGSTGRREGCRGCGASPGLQNQMLCPHRAVRRRPVLGQRETRFPQRKDYIIEQQNALNALGYITKVWAHYKTIRGPHSHI